MFYVIILTAILLPLLSKNKEIALKISFLALFILWGLQYEMVTDWPGNLARWNDVTSVLSEEVNVGYRTYEPLFVYLIRQTEAIGFFGWLIICAIFELAIFYILIKQYVPKQYYWLSIFILMLRADLGLLLINSNRQTLSLAFSMLGVIVLLYKNKNIFKNKIEFLIKSIAFLTIIFAASNIHSAAKMAYIILPIYILSHYVKQMPFIIIIIVNIAFIFQSFVNVSFLQVWATDFLGDIAIQDSFSSYMTMIDNSKVTFSVIEKSIYFIIMNGALFYYKDFKDNAIRFFAILVITTIIGKVYLYGNLSRALQYYYVYIILLVPHILIICLKSKEKFIVYFRKPILILICIYSIYAFNRELTHEHYYRWKNLKTIITAPEWK